MPDEIKPDPANARRHPERNRSAIRASLERLGAGRSVVVDNDNVLVAGNGVWAEAEALGIPHRVVETDGSELVVVKRTDLDGEDDRRKALAVADNRLTDLSEFDDDGLAKLLGGLDDGLAEIAGFDENELQSLFQDNGEISEDEPPPPPDEPVSERGCVYELGRHRVMCGDATAKSDVGRLLGDMRPNLMVTDPPYGVNYDQEWRSSNRTGKVANDDRFDWRDAYALFSGNVVYCWHACWHASAVQDGLESVGFLLRAQIIWVKTRPVFSQGHYHWQHEPCWYGVRGGATADWCGDRTQKTVWNMGLDPDVDGGHSTQKPVEIMARPIRNHQGDVYDPFLGSGTTLIAAEQLGRTCYGIDIEPRYVDVSIRRYCNLTGADFDEIIEGGK